MFNTSTSFNNQAASLLGAVAMSAACLFVAVSPARADTGFTRSVEQQISQTLRMPNPDVNGVATVAVKLAADGSVAGATVVRSSGDAASDAEAVRTAHTVRYPAGQARTVAMVLGFGRAPTAAERSQAAEQVALHSRNRQLLASTR